MKINKKWLKENRRYFVSFVLCLTLVIALLITANSKSQSVQNIDTSEKIKDVSESLFSTSSQLSDIQEELNKKIESVEQLKKEAKAAENVINLSSEQISAIQEMLHEEFDSNNKTSTVQSIAINAVFFVLGFVLNYLIAKIRKGSS